MRIGFKSNLMIIMLLALSCRLISNPYLAPGNISGYVSDYYGLAISGATIGLENGPMTTSGPDGYYFLEGVIEGDQNVGCGKAGYNISWIIVTVISGDTVFQDFTLTQPEMLINPLLIEETINPGEYFTTSLNILNTGSGPLGWQAVINYQSAPLIPCDYSIALYDTWGDGWNGCSVDVLVNDIVVLDNISLNSGSGPVYHYFTVLTGDQITTDFNPGPFVTEPYYYVYDGEGEQVWYSPAGNNGPPDILPGQLFASCAGGEWLTMDNYADDVPPFGGVDNIPTHLNAAGTLSGDIYEADIIFTSSPYVGTITIPVTMIIQGNEIIAPDNLSVDLVDDVTGKVELTWDWNEDSFQFFIIKRDGVMIATTTSQYYIDILKDHGLFCYTVQAVYNEGVTSPAGPLCVEWPDPVLNVEPDDIEGWVWTGYTVDVYTTISNLGVGTLSYTFPEFAALGLLNDPGIEKNTPGSPFESRLSDVRKGDESYNGKGYPIVLGAGGPDDFGYIWIDSDEPGGPSFNYTDISTTGNPIFGIDDDNIVGPIDIGFDFYFYGEIKSQFWINSNGCIGLTSNYITLQNTSIPTNSSAYTDFIAWMWDDLVFITGSSQAFYQVFPDKLIIQFKNYEHWGQADLHINAEVILHKNGKIMLMYDDFSAGVILNSCTIGLQSSTPGIGLQVAYNTTYLHNDLAILLKVPGDFITGVQPAFGTLSEGDSELITITYNSGDYLPGPYTQELWLESNDVGNEEFVIDNTMYVYLPAIFSGTVSDNDNDEPLNGVLVTAGPFQATTGEDGEYTLYVDEGNYDVVFEKLGYKIVTVRDTSAFQYGNTIINTGMWDMNYSPGFVHAEVMDNDTWCEITWSLPRGPYEIIMDDGEADDFFVYAQAGSWHAVKFTPAGYPATVIGGKFYVGDGSFPGPFLGTEFGVAVFDDDGADGLPGTLLDSTGVTVNNSGWVSLDWLNAVVNDGDFYLAMFQAGNAPFSAPIGIDSDNPTHFKSYSKFLDNDWSLSPLQDFMIRAWINGPENNDLVIKGIEGKDSRDVINYRVARYTNFDLDDPLAGGDFTDVAMTANLYYNENSWGAWLPGWYAFAVKALYTSGEYSDYTISNIVGHLMDCQASFNISLTTGNEPSNVEITLQGLDYPYETYTGITSEDGTEIFEMIWKGHYNIAISKVGYDIYLIENTLINADKIFNILLSEKKYAPTCLAVDPLTLKATWCEPLRTVLKEDFEDPLFPPAGWQESPQNSKWMRTLGSVSGWSVPPWDSYYACNYNGEPGSSSDGCCDYLITPPLDLRESENFALFFDSFYDGAFGQLAFVEYSYDAGATWEVMYQAMPNPDWTRLELDLAAFSGMNSNAPVWFAFHSDDAGSWGSGWAIDNVSVQVLVPAADYLDFSVFLDNAFVATTTETTWDFAPLAYGQTYTASVAARYSSGLSSKDYYTFTSTYLFPPQNLTGIAPDDAAILSWDPPGNIVPYNLLGYNIYRDEVFLDYRLHVGEWEPQGYVEKNMQPGIYSYTVTGVYDLEPYGLPGETGESMEEGPEIVIVDYCNELEFIETWTLGNFDDNRWISDGSNWSINGQTGNPAPVAEFSYTPVQTDYEISLESYPLCADGLTEGIIWLCFDLALYSIQPTGGESLQVQVWEWISQEWATVAEYNNIDGSFDWSPVRIDIRSIAMNKVFKIRFKAKGLNSADIRGWFVDNIHVFRTCIAPQELTIDPYYYDGFLLTWQLPENNQIVVEDGSRELTVFQIYRSENGGEFELLPNLGTNLYYIDPDSNLSTGSSYCYMVNAIYSGPGDQCESAFSNEACGLWTGVSRIEPSLKEYINLYPNPADDHVIIEVPDEFHHVTVYNTTGQPVFSQVTEGRQYELKTDAFPAGAYVVRVQTSGGVASRMLTIQR
jgi:hypothetical protein